LFTYTFVYLDADGRLIDGTSTVCENDAEAESISVRWRLPKAAAVEVWCGKDLIGKRSLDLAPELPRSQEHKPVS
jgi:hypothetical protein